MVFIIAGRLKLSELEVHELALSVVEDLKSMERFGDAAAVCLEYLHNNEDAIVFLTEARHLNPVTCLVFQIVL